MENEESSRIYLLASTVNGLPNSKLDQPNTRRIIATLRQTRYQDTDGVGVPR
jgi:hypothetical protein